MTYFGDRQEAQDVVQEAFCRALQRWKHVSAYDDPVAGVRRVALVTALEALPAALDKAGFAYALTYS